MNANLYATQNIAMRIATATGEVVNVTANAELIDTTSAELGMTVNQEAVADLPLNGRDPSTLALLAPGMVDAGKAGVVWTQSGFSFANESAASSNGGRIGSTFYMLDGVSNMDTYLGTNSPTPNPDATQEFRLISNNFSSVYGFSTGGVVSMATRSGTNQCMAICLSSCANGDLDAGNWIDHVQDTYRRNQFGGSVGGPAIKNHLFFFFNYQRTVVTGGPGTSGNPATTPTQQMLNGDFSGLVDYAEAHASNGSCGSNYGGPQTLTCGWLNGPFQVVDGKPNQLIGGAAALDPVAVQVTNDGLPGHTSPAVGTAPPTSTAQNLAGNLLYASAPLGKRHDKRVHRARRLRRDKKPARLASFVHRQVRAAGGRYAGQRPFSAEPEQQLGLYLRRNGLVF